MGVVDTFRAELGYNFISNWTLSIVAKTTSFTAVHCCSTENLLWTLFFTDFSRNDSYTYIFQIVKALVHKYNKATSERILTHWEALALFGRTASH